MLAKLKEVLPRPLKREVKRVFQTACEAPAYHFTRKGHVDWNFHHIVFVCKGNICRSAFAEYYLRSITPDGALRIESCGLDVDQGNFSPPDAVTAAAEFGVDLGGHHSKGMTGCDFQGAGLIVAMEFGQYLRLVGLYPQYSKKIRLLRDFSSKVDRILCNIYDPYGLGEAEFRRCFRGMQRALEGLKKHFFVVGK